MPDQITEALADYYGLLTALDAIREDQSSNEEKKKMIQSKLRSFPPMLYFEIAATVMNQVSAKKTNEQRVFQILFANAELKKLLGCESSLETPPTCFDAPEKRSALDSKNGSIPGVL